MVALRYGSVCSGIEAASVAWEPLGWQPAFFSEIAAFPRAVLAHHWPTVPLRGDFTEIRHGDHQQIEVLVGGTPCQSFSIAGKRAGLDDPRGNLALEFVRLAQRLRPQWVIWENVPGVLSQDGGRAFGAVVRALEDSGYGWAYRVLDAQHFGVPQRRRRVFLVGYLGDWRPPAAVLFEPESLRGDTAPGREKGKDVAPTLAARTKGGGGLGTDFECGGGLIANTGDKAACLTHHPARMDLDTETFVAHTLRREWNASEDGSGRGTPLVAPTLRALPNQGPGRMADDAARMGMVRRLTPTECERLQGFPDNHTLVPYRGKPAADGPRYAAIGNSMAVPVMHWIGSRIDTFEHEQGWL